MVSTTDVSVYIGRFSPFHRGHAHVLMQACKTSKLVLVLIGSSGLARSLKNPFTVDERREMVLHHWANEIGHLTNPTAIQVLEIRDYPYNNALWIRQVQNVVKRAVNEYNRVNPQNKLSTISVIGSDRDDSTWYLKSFPQWELNLVEPYRHESFAEVSATKVREWMFDLDAKSSLEGVSQILPPTTVDQIEKFSTTKAFEQLTREYNFIKSYKKSWEAAPYAPTFVTVDAVVVQSGHILTVKRKAEPGEGLWALPGGFVNQGERLLDAAIRELVEETGIRLAEGKKAAQITTEILKGSLRDKEVFDAPDRSARGRTITTAYLFRLDDTKPLPKVRGMDDAADAFWIPINDALEQTSMWFEDHHAIIETLVATKDI